MNENDILEVKEEIREIKTKIKEKEESEKESKLKEKEAEAKLNKALEKYEQLVAKWENDPSESNQKKRDGGVCVLTKTATTEGAHIIPYAFADKYPSEWVRLYEQYSKNPKHGVHDIRNGMLLTPTLHTQFGKHWFTVELSDGVYTVKTGNHPDVQWLSGKVIEFPNTDTSPAA
ncbi:hypothetical protein HDU91_000318, partial [Kappamyces sp. JEL0680]